MAGLACQCSQKLKNVLTEKKEARGATFTYVLHMYTCTCVFFSKQSKLMLI